MKAFKIVCWILVFHYPCGSVMGSGEGDKGSETIDSRPATAEVQLEEMAAKSDEKMKLLYIATFVKYLESKEFREFPDRSETYAREHKLNTRFYIAGVIRGMIGKATVEGLREAAGGPGHIRQELANPAMALGAETIGWRSGCGHGIEIGEKLWYKIYRETSAEDMESYERVMNSNREK